jgi:filamentous hemagglutinin family protein
LAGLTTAALLLWALTGMPVQAEVVVHGAASPLPGPRIVVDGNLGSQVGGNLFHSFSVFNVLPPGKSPSGVRESVRFTAPSGGVAVNNVINRVTGGTSSFTGNQASLIDGRIRSSMPGANFFLINPHGVMFGGGARLSVSGSFHAGTADFVRFADGSVYMADPAGASTLTAASPTAFGFVNPTPAPVQMDGRFEMAQGTTLSLVGGDITIGEDVVTATPGKTTSLFAPAGRVNLVSVASAGELALGDPNLDVGGFSALGAIEMSDNSVVDAREVVIRSGRFEMEDAIIVPGFFSRPSEGSIGPPPDGGGVNVEVSGDVSIAGSGPVRGFPAGIFTFAGSTTEINPPRSVPDISVEAGGTVSVSGVANIRSERFGRGPAADVTISADAVEVRNGAFLAVNNFFRGQGGTLTVNANSVLLSGDGNPLFTGIAAQANFNPGFNSIFMANPFDTRLSTAAGGTITVNAARSLTVREGAEISADSFSLGRGGSITINAGDIFLSRNGANTGAIATQSVIAGNSGNLRIEAKGVLDVKDGFQISASTGGTGDGGKLVVRVANAIRIEGTDSGIFSTTAPAPEERLDDFAREFGAPDFDVLVNATRTALGIADPTVVDVLTYLDDTRNFIEVNDRTPGSAGGINVSTPSLTLSGESRIDSSTFTDGDAGSVRVNAGIVSLVDGAQIRSQSGAFSRDTGQLVVGKGSAGTVSVAATDTLTIKGASPTGTNSAVSTSTLGEGNAGDVLLQRARIEILDGGRVVSETSSSGNAGTLEIKSTDLIVVSGSGSSISTSSTGSGDGGDVSLEAFEVQILNDGAVRADSTSSGLAGSIRIEAAKQIILHDSTVSTRAVTSDGGDITMVAPILIDLMNSEITTSVESGVGGGGNIDIDPAAVVLQNSAIVANAFGGPGGNIRIVAGQFIIDQNSTVTASSKLGIDGLVEINAPDTNITGKLVPLPKDFLDASKLLRDRCGSRGGTSSFSAKGRGGVPPGPDGYLPSYAMGDTAHKAGGTEPARDVYRTDEGPAGGSPFLAMAGTLCTW